MVLGGYAMVHLSVTGVRCGNNFLLGYFHTVPPPAGMHPPIAGMYLGCEYGGRKAMEELLREDDLIRGTDSMIKKSDRSRWRVRCNREPCGFIINARVIVGSDAWKITCISPHTCDPGSLSERKRTWMRCDDIAASLVHELDAKVSGRDVRQRVLQEQPPVVPRIKRGMLHNLKLKMNHSRFGDSRVEQYSHLRSLMQLRKQADPGGTYDVRASGSDHFLSCFAAPAFTRDTFQHALPVVALDAAVMKSKGAVEHLYLAVCRDSGGFMMPLAIGIMGNESVSTWEMFLQQLRDHLTAEALNIPEALVIMSDRCKGIEVAVHHVFPEASNVACLKHLERNVQAEAGVKDARRVMQLGSALTKVEFDELHKQLSQKAQDYLADIEPAVWAVHASAKPRYGITTSNWVECMNNTFMRQRESNVCDAVQGMLKWMDKAAYERRQRAAAGEADAITPHFAAQQESIQRSVHHMQVPGTTSQAIPVLCVWSGKEYLVEMHEGHGTCSCNGWLHHGLPCAHALAVRSMFPNHLRYVQQISLSLLR